MASPPISLPSLLAACVAVATDAGRIIREVASSGDLMTSDKKSEGGSAQDVESMDASAVVTIADERSQDCIVNSLRKKFPGLRIVGEEGEVPPGADVIEISDAATEKWAEALPQETLAALKTVRADDLTLSSVCIWVDPLDGTKEFACKRVEACSVLIGVTVNDVPFAGVIFEPFRNAPDGSLGVTTVGVVGVGLVLSGGQLQSRPASDVVVTTSVKDKPAVKTALEGFIAECPSTHMHRLGACGNKLLRLVEGTVDIFIQGPGTCRWDSCAGEALVRCVGGLLTDLNGEPYYYLEHESFDNSTGVLAALKPELHARMACHGRAALAP